MKTIKFNKEVSTFLMGKLQDTIKLEEILNTAVYNAEQNGTIQARRIGMAYEEMAVLASLKVAEIIQELFGDVEIFGTSRYSGEKYKINKTQYCQFV